MRLADKYTFSDIVDILSKIRGNGNVSNADKCTLIRGFYDECRQSCQNAEAFQVEWEPFLTLFLPDSNEQRKFDMGEKKLADIVSRVLVSPSLKTSYLKGASRVAEQLAREVSQRVAVNKEYLTVTRFCGLLDDLCSSKGTIKDDRLMFIMKLCNEKELIWFFNLIMRNVETYAGYTRRSFFSAISPEANSAWDDNRDLRTLHEYGGEKGPDFYLGANFSPMLLARLTMDTIDQQVASNLVGGFFMETKYDGEHVIMHKRGDQYKWFTRNGKDYTEHYGGSSSEKLAGRIHNSFRPSLHDCIIDCELMHYVESTGQLIRHLEKSDDDRVVLNYRNPQPGHRIVVVVFDMLYFAGVVNGVMYQDDLTSTPLSDRVQVMADRLLIRNETSNIFVADRTEGSTGDDIRAFYDKAMQAKQEGIAIKRKDSLYFVGQRSKQNGWFKLKDRFDVDLVIVGVVPAKDERGSAYLLAAWDSLSSFQSGSTASKKQLHVICKSYTGLSKITRKEIMDAALRDGKLLSAAEAPSELLAWTSDTTCQYFRRSDWKVVEVTSFGVRNGHMIDVVMRRIRDDKTVCPEDIDEYRLIKKYVPGQSLSSAEEKDEDDSTAPSIVKLKRVTKGDIFSNSVIPEAKRPKTEATEDGPVSNHSDECQLTLKGKTVAVLQSFDESLRKRCMAILQSFGATVVANPTSSTVLLVAPSDNHMRVKSAVTKASLPIVRAQWLLRCEQENRLQPWTSDDVILEVDGGFSL